MVLPCAVSSWPCKGIGLSVPRACFHWHACPIHAAASMLALPLTRAGLRAISRRLLCLPQHASLIRIQGLRPAQARPSFPFGRASENSPTSKLLYGYHAFAPCDRTPSKKRLRCWPPPLRGKYSVLGYPSHPQRLRLHGFYYIAIAKYCKRFREFL